MFDILRKMRYYNIRDAEVSELADEQDSGSCERYAREGSSPFFRMMNPEGRCLRDFLFRRKVLRTFLRNKKPFEQNRPAAFYGADSSRRLKAITAIPATMPQVELSRLPYSPAEGRSSSKEMNTMMPATPANRMPSAGPDRTGRSSSHPRRAPRGSARPDRRE